MKYKIQILKKIDAIIGTPAVHLSRLIRPRKSEFYSLDDLQSPVSKNFDKLKILVIRPGGIGDAVLLFPALKILKDIYANCNIDILAEKRNQGIFENCEFINELILYDNDPIKALKKVFSNNYEIVIDTEQWHRLTSVVACLTRAPVRVGYGTNERRRMFTNVVQYSHDDYESQSFLNLVSGISKREYEFDKNSPFVPVDDSRCSDLNKQLIEYSSKWDWVAGIFCGATVSERIWGVDKFIKTTAKLLESNIGVVILGAKSELGDCIRIERSVGKDNILNLTNKTSLYQTAVVISKLNLFVSADTGLMHIAYGVGTPTVSLLGAGIEKKWGPKGDDNININKNLPCSPCTSFGYTPSCPIGVKCLQDISVDEVVNSSKKLLYAN